MRECWVNVYDDGYGPMAHRTRHEADAFASTQRRLIYRLRIVIKQPKAEEVWR